MGSELPIDEVRLRWTGGSGRSYTVAMRTILLVALLPACGPGQLPPRDGDGPAIYGRVVGLFGSAIDGVRVCIDGSDLPCATSASDGAFLIEDVKENANLVVTMRKDDYLPTAYQHYSGVDDVWHKTLMTQGLVDRMQNRADTTWRPGYGHAMFILWSDRSYDSKRVSDVSASVVDQADIPVFYQDAFGMPDLNRAATSGMGGGAAFNLPPGEHLLHFSGDITCEPWFSHDFTPGDPVPVRVLPDLASYIDLVCR